LKRLKDEMEQKRRELIQCNFKLLNHLAKFPLFLKSPVVIIESANSIKATVDISDICENNYEFSIITLQYGTDPLLSNKNESKIIQIIPGKGIYSVNCENLTNGISYFFHVRCGHLDVHGPFSEQVSLRVGILHFYKF
jgi:hypothetical protein